MSHDDARRPLEILLVEDNPGDVRLTLEVLKDATISNRISVVKDGIEAMAFLRRQGKHAHAPRPDLILLDLNLPKKDGLELLSEINHDPSLRDIRVVILTTSEADYDITQSFSLDASCYLIKPIDLDRFHMLVQPQDG